MQNEMLREIYLGNFSPFKCTQPETEEDEAIKINLKCIYSQIRESDTTGEY